MRRRLEALIPIVLFVVMVQLFAPIAAFRAFASAVDDPLYMASVCSDMSSSANTPEKTQHHHGECCAFCAVGHGGSIAVGPPLPIFVSLQRQYQLVFWLEAADRSSTVRIGSNAQARAPPAIS